MEMPQPGIFFSECLGYMRGEDAKAFIHYGQTIINSHGSLRGFHDWTAVMGYTNEARLVTTEWTVRNAGRLTEVHIALSSTIVRMAVAVANIGLRGKITIHDSIPSLEAAQRLHMR